VLIIALVLAALASLLHVYIWWLESFAWTGAARKVFGTSAEQAEQTRELAYNQGFYNLFLAITGIIGVVLLLGDHEDAVGTTLVVVALGSMLSAALVLLLSSPDKRQAAINQGLLPLLGLLALLGARV
jgi:putative membrane protein